jgi:hypothetical protein
MLQQSVPPTLARSISAKCGAPFAPAEMTGHGLCVHTSIMGYGTAHSGSTASAGTPRELRRRQGARVAGAGSAPATHIERVQSIRTSLRVKLSMVKGNAGASVIWLSGHTVAWSPPWVESLAAKTSTPVAGSVYSCDVGMKEGSTLEAQHLLFHTCAGLQVGAEAVVVHSLTSSTSTRCAARHASQISC